MTDLRFFWDEYDIALGIISARCSCYYELGGNTIRIDDDDYEDVAEELERNGITILD